MKSLTFHVMLGRTRTAHVLIYKMKDLDKITFSEISLNFKSSTVRYILCVTTCSISQILNICFIAFCKWSCYFLSRTKIVLHSNACVNISELWRLNLGFLIDSLYIFYNSSHNISGLKRWNLLILCPT